MIKRKLNMFNTHHSLGYIQPTVNQTGTCVSYFVFFAYPDILANHFLPATPAHHGDFYVHGGRFPCSLTFPHADCHRDVIKALSLSLVYNVVVAIGLCCVSLRGGLHFLSLVAF